jgi:hypothetical protein
MPIGCRVRAGIAPEDAPPTPRHRQLPALPIVAERRARDHAQMIHTPSATLDSPPGPFHG